MTTKMLALLLTVVAMTAAVVTWGANIDHKVRSGQEIQDALTRNQETLIEWKNTELERKRRLEAERKVIKDLCDQGALPPEKCQ